MIQKQADDTRDAMRVCVFRVLPNVRKVAIDRVGRLLRGSQNKNYEDGSRNTVDLNLLNSCFERRYFVLVRSFVFSADARVVHYLCTMFLPESE